MSVCLFAPRFLLHFRISEFQSSSCSFNCSLLHGGGIDLPKITSSGPIDGTISPTLLDTVDVDEDRENIFDLAREQLALLLTRCDKRDGTDMACAGSTGSGNPAEAGAKDALMIVDEAETQQVAETARKQMKKIMF